MKDQQLLDAFIGETGVALKDSKALLTRLRRVEALVKEDSYNILQDKAKDCEKWAEKFKADFDRFSEDRERNEAYFWKKAADLIKS